MLAAKPDNVEFDCLGSRGGRRRRTHPHTIMVMHVNKEARNIKSFCHFSQVYSLVWMIDYCQTQRADSLQSLLLNQQEKRLYCLFLVSI